MDKTILVVGLGEVGRPLLEVIRERYDAVGIDLEPVDLQAECEVMHLCYGYEDFPGFLASSCAYIEKYRPGLTIVNSTVPPGTTRAICCAAGAPVVHSPVRGKHFKMKAELLHYTKFIGGVDEASSRQAAEHFGFLGMRTQVLSSPEATELAKLAETTCFGLLIAWAQEVERYCAALGLDYDEVAGIYDEIGFFPPVRYFPGVIGGHCVLPNIRILKERFDSQILAAIEGSNQMKVEREKARAGQNPAGRVNDERR
jgi:UDP-N-acetyl-D-mannosaminuronate dehydrogenase